MAPLVHPLAHLWFIQSFEPRYNFVPTLKLSFCCFGARASWSWISSCNPPQKLIGLWHPAGLLSPRNLCPQFLKLRFDVYSSVCAAPTRPADDILFPRLYFLDLWPYFPTLDWPLRYQPLCWNQNYRSGMKKRRRGAKWLTDELPFLGRSSLKPRCAIPTSAWASLCDLWSLGPYTANPT